MILPFAVALILGCTDTPAAEPIQLPSARAPVVDSLRAARNAAVTTQRRSAITEAAEVASPAVVSVNVVRRQRTVRRSPFDLGFFPRVYEQIVPGLGSGFIISPDGIVITNQHVTSDADEIVVTTREGRDFPARLLGEDPLTDIAVLRIEGPDLPVLAVGSSRDLEIGEWVVAIGSPYGYLLGDAQPSVTAGVVSAVGRNLLPSDNQPGIYVGMIQTDAAINPGNSGGPLVNVLGEVVGVNSSIFTNSGGSVGIGFAIPIERAVRVADDLVRFGAVRRAWVGVDIAGADELQRWKQTGGLRVTGVAPGSPAADAGLRPDDILLAVRGRTIRTFLDWEAVKLDLVPGDTITVEYRRDADRLSAHIPVETLPSARAERVSVLDIELIEVNPQIQQERGLLYDFGVLITNIPPRAAQITGLQPGDVILQVNRSRVQNPQDLQSLFSRAAGRQGIQVFFERNGRIRTTSFYVQ